MQNITLSWSSGKDSAWALHQLNQNPDIQVESLFCTVNQQYQRAAMHATRIQLIQQQANSAGLPIEFIPIPNPCSNQQYEDIMHQFLLRTKQSGISAIAYGDLFLDDVRQYRQRLHAEVELDALFPLWGKATNTLSQQMLDAGLRAKLTCLDPKQMDRHYAGIDFDYAFLDSLPKQVDPCGENGEFHTFTYAGPMFKEPIAVVSGDTVERDGFVFTDLLLAPSDTGT